VGRKAERLGVEELTNVRATGEKWTATISSITGIFGVVALIKGPEDITKLQGIWEALVIGAILVAVALALAGSSWLLLPRTECLVGSDR
jgi:hypothetical protein